MIRHGLLNWVSYAHSLPPPVPSQLSFYISFVLCITSLYVFIPQLCQWVVIFISSLSILQVQPVEISSADDIFHLVN